MDKNLNSLLKWSIETSSRPSNGGASDASAQASQQAAAAHVSDNRELLQALLGGTSEADLMVASMQAIRSTDPAMTLESRLVAFDNLEQLVESLDNANNLENLALWAPLLDCLAHDEPDIRRMAAWCVGTAVQNNAKTQDRLHALGGIVPLVRLALSTDEHRDVKKKAVYALSSAVRNHQPGMDACLHEITRLNGQQLSHTDATDMDEVDELIRNLREQVKG